MSHRISVVALALLAVTLAIPAVADALMTCTFTTVGTTMTLDGDCTTDSPIVVPDGYVLDGSGFTITAVDPVGRNFRGGVVEARPRTIAHVTRLGVTVKGLRNVCDSGANRLRGILFEGAGGSITHSDVTGINQGPSGCQEGNGIEVRNFGSSPTTVTVAITDNVVTAYQKTGIVVNGDVDAVVTGNYVAGAGPVAYIAQNGIQVGYGARAAVMRNVVTGNAYTGRGWVSGGILVVGGPLYGGDFCVNTRIVGNTIEDNDVGVYLSQYEADYSPPRRPTNIKVINNVITNDAVTNGYVYQAGVSDVGNNDKIIANTIKGAGYDPATLPGSTFDVDADTSFTSRPKVHANR